jgi:cyclohexadienyl dehydratase
MSLAILLLAIAVSTIAPEAAAQPSLRVGTSGDYPPFSLALGEDPVVFEGFDLDLARDFSATQGLPLIAVRFRWPHLLRDLSADRFDVAMSGVTITPERSAVGAFSVPVVETGAVVLARRGERFPNVDSLDQSEIRIGVNAGGYLEGVARGRFRHATLVMIPDNSAVLDAFVAGHLDAVVTDTAEAAGWMAAAGDVTLMGPLTRDRKAYLLRADRPDLAAQLDRFLLEREADGSLAALRALHLGPNGGPPVARPLQALLAAIDERLSLMPLVAVAKQRRGLPLVAAGREAVVLAAGVEAVGAAAAAAGTAPPSEVLVRALYRALIEAAKQVQRTEVQPTEVQRTEVRQTEAQQTALKNADSEDPADVPDLDDALRPALLRIGEKIARLVVALPAGLDRTSVWAAAVDQLRTPQLTLESKRAIADALAVLSNAPAARGG